MVRRDGILLYYIDNWLVDHLISLWLSEYLYANSCLVFWRQVFRVAIKLPQSLFPSYFKQFITLQPYGLQIDLAYSSNFINFYILSSFCIFILIILFCHNLFVDYFVIGIYEIVNEEI